MEDGVDHGFAEVILPSTPLTNSSERLTVVLEPPSSNKAVLSDDAITALNVIHDVGE